MKTNEWIAVDGGSFTMGNAYPDETTYESEIPAHKATVRSFRMARCPVTVGEWMEFAESEGEPDAIEAFRDYAQSIPVHSVCWYDAIRYCNWLSRKDGLQECYRVDSHYVDERNLNTEDELKWKVEWDSSANGYRLPTEAEWEFAARGGIESDRLAYAGSDSLSEVAWFFENSGNMPHPVGTKRPNKLGFCDMNGNVWEWCWDWYGAYSAAETVDSVGADSGTDRVLRGQAWNCVEKICRITVRSGDDPSYRNLYYGIRIASNQWSPK